METTADAALAPSAAPVLDCRWDVMSAACPSRQVLGRVADKWTMLVLSALSAEEVLRFSELRRRIEGVTQKMLTQTLRTLERDGLVTRTVYPTIPPKVEYAATELGESVTALMHAIRAWSEENINAVLDARDAYEARAAQEVQPVTA